MEDVKPWYYSRTVWGALIAILASLAELTGMELGGAEQAELADLLVAFVATGGGLLALFGRITARRRLG